MAQRDQTLDFIKGFGCLLMVFSHSRVLSPTTATFLAAWCGLFFGGFAPVFFYSVSGIVNALQARRYPLRYFAIFAALFALYGLTYNTLWRPDILHNLASDIPQFAAFMILTTVIIEKVSSRAIVGYGVAIFVILGLHYGLEPYLPPFPGRQFLFIPGVFPIIPWLIFPYLGNVAYRLSDRAVKIIALLLTTTTAGTLVVALGILHYSGSWFEKNWHAKYSMPFGYLLIALSLQFLLFTAVRMWPVRFTHPIVEYVGRNSFPFLFLHIFWIRLFMALHVYHPAIVWPSVLVLTLLAMYVVDSLNSKYLARLFTSPYAWGGLLVVLLANVAMLNDHAYALVMSGLTLLFGTIRTFPAHLNVYLMSIIGVLFAYNYHALARIIKGLVMPHVPAPREVIAAPLPVGQE